MIYLEQTDPADAKPGDLMLIESTTAGEYLMLYMCIIEENGSRWIPVRAFDFRSYSSEIIDGKPTPELITRFTTPEKKGESLEIFGTVFIEKPWGIIQVPPVDSIWIGDNSCGRREYIVGATNMKKIQFASEEMAERERARLIQWLEG